MVSNLEEIINKNISKGTHHLPKEVLYLKWKACNQLYIFLVVQNQNTTFQQYKPRNHILWPQ
jgi:hypothetical protein